MVALMHWRLGRGAHILGQVKLIEHRFLMDYCRQKKICRSRIRDLELMIEEWVLLKITLIK